MRIEITGDKSISRQTRTYAEYRLFTVLSQTIDTARVREASLLLTRPGQGPGRDGAVCSVMVTLHSGETARLRTSGDHPYAAINRAVQQLERNGALRRHRPSLTSATVTE